MSSLAHTTIRKIWDGEYDQVTSSEAIVYDNTLIASSSSFDLDLGQDLALTPARYTKLLRDYIDPSHLHKFLSRAREIGTGCSKEGAIAGLATRPVPRTDTKHRFGNCITAFMYRGSRAENPTLTMFSRTSYISYIGLLDLAVAHHLIREIARRIELHPDSFRFVWQSASLQFHTLKSLPYLIAQPWFPRSSTYEPRNQLQKLTLAWHRKFSQSKGQLNGESRFGPVKRVQAVYRAARSRTERPSYPISEMGLEVICT